jgi:hypothetical protein
MEPTQPRKFNVWVMFRRPPAGDNQWEAHVLDLDVVTYGNSLTHAVEMAIEAAHMVLADDLEDGRDPFERRAPDEDWLAMYELQASASEGAGARLRTLGELISDPDAEASVQRVAVNLEVVVQLDAAHALGPGHSPSAVPDRGMALSECA